jgi:hypothetical protein
MEMSQEQTPSQNSLELKWVKMVEGSPHWQRIL